MNVQPYLFFEGQCEEAIAFYRGAVGAEVQMQMRYKDSPEKDSAPLHADPEKIMHATVKIGGSTVMMSDGQCSGKPAFNGVSLALAVADEAEAQRAFAALAEGGQPFMPLTKTFFSPQFGMLTDRFGLMWMVMVEA
nr:VOC family protein [uncultured Rhodopila sp.]